MMHSSLEYRVKNSNTHKYNFWILWIAANGTGTVIGTITFYILAMSLGFFGPPMLPGQESHWEIAWQAVVADFQTYLPFGGLIGTMQWLILHKQIANVGFWFLTSAIAMLIGGIVGDIARLFFDLRPIFTELFLFWFLFGCISGILQWIILRKQVHYAGWWIVANIVAGTLAGIFFPDYLGFLGGCLAWAFSGIITGGTIFFLLQNRKGPKPKNVA